MKPVRDIIVADGVARIELNTGDFAFVDECDVHLIAGNNWYLSKTGYVRRAVPRVNGRNATIDMHRLIVECPQGQCVDHVDRNKLNNRRSNLRLATNSLNQANRRSKRGENSLKGFTWNRASGKWQASIKKDGKYKHLGMFDTAEDANKAYEQAAKAMFGEFARSA